MRLCGYEFAFGNKKGWSESDSKGHVTTAAHRSVRAAKDRTAQEVEPKIEALRALCGPKEIIAVRDKVNASKSAL
jgi:hypothetical protein